MRNYNFLVLDEINKAQNIVKAMPMNFGGISSSGGGQGGPPGGFIGWLPQTRVAFDTDEFASPLTPGSATLLDNLNHIRFRIATIEASGAGQAGQGFIVQKNDVQVGSGVVILNFEGSGLQDVVQDYQGKITVLVSGGGGGLTKSGTPVDNQVAVWTSSTNLEGTTGLTFDGNNLAITSATDFALTVNKALVISEMTAPASTPSAGTGYIYLAAENSVGKAFLKNDDGTIFDLTKGAALGASVSSSWRFNTATTNSDPGSKQFKLNNSTYASVTALYFNDTTVAGNDSSGVFSLLQTGARVYVQQANDGSKIALYQLTSAPTDNTGWWTLSVSYVNAVGSLFTSNAECGILIYATSASGGGHTIQEEGSSLTQRTKLNFVGTGVTATDDAGNDATKITITVSGGSGASTFLDLTDTPTTYSGYFGQFVVVASGGGLEFYDSGSRVYSEVIVATGANFLTEYVFAQDSLRVYLNGIRQDPSQYTPLTTGSGFSTNFTVLSSDKLAVDYDTGITVLAGGSSGSGGPPGFQTLTSTSSGIVNWNLADGSGEITLVTGTTVLMSPTNMGAGEHYFLNVKQDSIGNRLLLFENKYKFPSNIRPILSTYHDHLDTLPFECDGNYMYSLGIHKNMENRDIPLEYQTNLTMWLKADANVYSDNGTTPCVNDDLVYLWADQTANNNDAVQVTSGNRPQFKSSVLNNRPALRFATNDDLVVSTLDAGNNCSFFIVVIPGTTTPIGLFDSSGNYSVDPIRNDPAGNWDCYYNEPATDMVLSNTNPVILEFIHSQSSGRTVVYYKNGIYVSSNFNGNTDSYIWDIPRIGSINGGESYYSGDILEFLLYSETIGTTNRALVENYLKSKYGI